MTFKYIKNRSRLHMQNLTAFVITVLLLSACVKNDELYSLDEGTIYMPQAFQDKAIMTLYRMDAPQSVAFGAYYGGFNAPSNDITVNFEIDPSLIDNYNMLNSYLGYSYYLLPDSLYTLSATSTVIKSGEKSSEPLTINVEGRKVQFGYKYMLPIRITSVSEGKADSALSVALFRLDTLLTRTTDLTSNATLTVSTESSGGATSGEGSSKLVDGSPDTKFLADYNTDFWVQLSFAEATHIDAYDMTSANDAAERDPKNWELVGSNDGSTWISLDVRENELFADRNFNQRYTISNPGSYRYYRLNITANGGAGVYQQSEWRLLQFN